MRLWLRGLLLPDRAGYDVEVIDVGGYALSEERIASRWRGDYLDALEKGEGLGGRWVPSKLAREFFNELDGKPRPETAAQASLREHRTWFDSLGTAQSARALRGFSRSTRYS